MTGEEIRKMDYDPNRKYQMRYGGDANLGSSLSAVGVLTNRMYIQG